MRVLRLVRLQAGSCLERCLASYRTSLRIFFVVVAYILRKGWVYKEREGGGEPWGNGGRMEEGNWANIICTSTNQQKSCKPFFFFNLLPQAPRFAIRNRNHPVGRSVVERTIFFVSYLWWFWFLLGSRVGERERQWCAPLSMSEAR